MFGYFKRHWKGELSLPLSYWVNGTILGMLILVVSKVIEQETNWYYSVPFIVSFVALTVFFTIWSLVGIWRSAGNYIFKRATANPKRPTYWGYIAKFMVIIGALNALVSYVPVFKDMAQIVKHSDDPVNTQFFIQPVGDTDIMLTGYINAPSVEAIKKAFDEQGRIALLLNSPGGQLGPAIQLAEFVSERQIITGATQTCHSGCMLVLASGKVRLVTPGTHLAFHHPETFFEVSNPEAKSSFDTQVQKYYSIFKKAGTPTDRLDQLRQAVWYDLSIAEAFNMFFIDRIWEPDTGTFSEIPDWCQIHDCTTKITTVPAQ